MISMKTEEILSHEGFLSSGFVPGMIRVFIKDLKETTQSVSQLYLMHQNLGNDFAWQLDELCQEAYKKYQKNLEERELEINTIKNRALVFNTKSIALHIFSFIERNELVDTLSLVCKQWNGYAIDVLKLQSKQTQNNKCCHVF